MWEEVKKSIVSISITLITSVVAITLMFGDIKAKVEAHEEKLKHTVFQSEFQAITKAAERYNDDVVKRIDRIENKIDKILDRVKEK